MFFLIAQLELGDNYLHDSWQQDVIENLPDGSMMLVADIRKMKDGQPFRIYPEVGKLPINYRPASYDLFLVYLELFITSSKWGLPNGRGWANESVMCIKILMHFSELQDKIDMWRIQKSNKGR